jgi:hypothetical protein
MDLEQVMFDAAIERNRCRIDAMPHGPERDALIEGIADAVGAFVWQAA